MRSTAIPLASACLLAAAVAQEPLVRTHRRPVDDGTEREIHSKDIHGLLAAVLERRHDPFAGDEPRRRVRMASLTRQLAEATRAFIEPPLEAGEDVCALGTSHLVAIARPEQHAWIDRFLALQQQLAARLVKLEVRILQLDAKSRRALEIGSTPKLLDADARRRLLRRVAREKGAQVLAAPALTALSNQRCTVSIGRQISYVRDFEVTFDDDTAVADPVVDVVEAGMKFGCEVVALPGDRLGIAFEVEVNEVDEPIAEKKIRVLPDLPEVKIQTPTVRGVELDSSIAMALAEAALLPLPAFEGRYHAVLIDASIGPVPPGGRR